MNRETAHQAVLQAIEDLSGKLIDISQRIHRTPEIGLHEQQASGWLCDALREDGFSIEMGLAGMETSFRARSGTGDRPQVAILCEYDALAGLGHACGHNLIATAGLGAALAVRRAFSEVPGTLYCIGTPAEETIGGKIPLVDAGVFDGLDAAMMFHPGNKNLVTRGALACVGMTFRFYGKPAHAAAAPQRGINALDAAIQTFNGINAMRQHVDSAVRIHGIITKGGDAANVVPEYAEAQFVVRHRTRAELLILKQKVRTCAEAGAAMAGARVEIEEGLVMAERNNNPSLAERFGQHLESLGLRVDEPPQGGYGSSDIGNVSLVCPTIHPYLTLVPEGVSGHTHEFMEAAGSDAGMQVMLNAARALALTAVDLFLDPEFVRRARGTFEESLAQYGA